MDYYSTAATISIATNKPIIYFDLGWRNLHVDFLTRLKNRCYFVGMDLHANIATQVSHAVAGYRDCGHEFVNDITEDLCLSGVGMGGVLSEFYRAVRRS